MVLAETTFNFCVIVLIKFGIVLLHKVASFDFVNTCKVVKLQIEFTVTNKFITPSEFTISTISIKISASWLIQKVQNCYFYIQKILILYYLHEHVLQCFP